jgi:hypothetical protein
MIWNTNGKKTDPSKVQYSDTKTYRVIDSIFHFSYRYYLVSGLFACQFPPVSFLFFGIHSIQDILAVVPTCRMASNSTFKKDYCQRK